MRLINRTVLLLIVVVHLTVSALHGVAHVVLQIDLTPFQTAFVAGVITAAPFMGLVLLFTRYPRAGAVVVITSMLGALVFGLVYHVILPGPDNISTAGLGGWAITFQATGVALSILETVAALAGTWFLRSRPSGVTK